MKVEVYSKPACVQCVQSKRMLEKFNINYVEYDVIDNADAYDFVVNILGYRAAPVIVIRNSEGEVAESWSGFNPDKLSELKQTIV
jgi:glutaredoxin-like protein NrdH